MVFECLLTKYNDNLNRNSTVTEINGIHYTIISVVDSFCVQQSYCARFKLLNNIMKYSLKTTYLRVVFLLRPENVFAACGIRYYLNTIARTRINTYLKLN